MRLSGGARGPVLAPTTDDAPTPAATLASVAAMVSRTARRTWRLRPSTVTHAQAGRRQNIEKSTRTRVIVADKRVHILGAVDNVDQVPAPSQPRPCEVAGQAGKAVIRFVMICCVMCAAGQDSDFRPGAGAAGGQGQPQARRHLRPLQARALASRLSPFASYRSTQRCERRACGRRAARRHEASRVSVIDVMSEGKPTKLVYLVYYQSRDKRELVVGGRRQDRSLGLRRWRLAYRLDLGSCQHTPALVSFARLRVQPPTLCGAMRSRDLAARLFIAQGPGGQVHLRHFRHGIGPYLGR